MKKLNLGCGKDYMEGFVNVDFCKGENFKVDINHNLETFPYPFEDDSCDYILMDNVLEHLNDTIKVLEEIHRITKDNAKIEIIVPHYSTFMAFGHLTHKQFFAGGRLDNFKPDSWEKYSDKSFYVDKEFIWLNSRNNPLLRPMKKFMNWLLNKNHYFTERFLANLVGIDHIKFTLKTIK